jgi:hypothetical protein
MLSADGACIQLSDVLVGSLIAIIGSVLVSYGCERHLLSRPEDWVIY